MCGENPFKLKALNVGKKPIQFNGSIVCGGKTIKLKALNVCVWGEPFNLKTSIVCGKIFDLKASNV